MRVLDLFAGVGGFSLGLEQTGGFKTAAFCEIDPHARLVLQKHWPNIPIFEDVSTLTKDQINAQIDVITGGFPCQDISSAGRGAGLAGERSGLWFQYHRLIKEIRPRYAIIENVSALRGRGLDQVLWSLAEIGYDAEWHCIPASAVGAPHRRDRIWIIAYPNSQRGRFKCEIANSSQRSARDEFSGGGDIMANPSSQRQQRQGQLVEWGREAAHGEGQANKPLTISLDREWPVEPALGRVAYGVPNRSHRLKQLGNAIVPKIAKLIGQAILAEQWGGDHA